PKGARTAAKIHENEISIDLKRGTNGYVVGPSSVRPDGKMYKPIVGILGKTPLPVFEANPQSPDSGNISNIKPPGLSYMQDGNKTCIGHRNMFLMQRAVSFVECAESETELLDQLKAQRDYECEEPESVADNELIAMARWAWQLRLSNQIFKGRESGVFFKRSTMDKLLPLAYGQNAFALYCVLRANHGHAPGKRFTISPEGMKRDGLISFGRNACDRARNHLIAHGFLKRVSGYKPGIHAQHYQLTR
ncbi:MAG: hypothetical protein K8F25_15995, partial [Fimbriimonadaceae bacterium]|nr:hypothetical protein [Alphaproteobacteria bacterium]